MNEETSRLVKFILLAITSIPSLLCDLIIFTYLIRRWRREILAAPQNHVILCLLVVSFIQKTVDVPSLLHYYRSSDVMVHNDTFCSVWNWVDYSFIIGSLHLLTWCCIERHLFVFHSQLMKERKYLILLHYIPLAVAVIYLPSLHASMIFFPTSCSNRMWSSMLYLSTCFRQLRLAIPLCNIHFDDCDDQLTPLLSYCLAEGSTTTPFNHSIGFHLNIVSNLFVTIDHRRYYSGTLEV